MRYLEVRKARIEIIPMIDIIFFLLVFFVMITLKMIPTSGIASKLPQSSTANSLDKPKILLTVAADGAVAEDGKPIQLAVLTAQLKASGKAADTAVTIASDAHVNVQQLMAVMDACRLGGVTELGLAAKQTAANP